MTATLSSLANLKANPAWVNLPLFRPTVLLQGAGLV